MSDQGPKKYPFKAITSVVNLFDSESSRRAKFSEAARVFEADSGLKKISRQDQTYNIGDHSFIKLGNEIYMVNEGIGKGAFGHVKSVIDKEGNLYAIKVENEAEMTANPLKAQLHTDEREVLDMLEIPYIQGEMSRESESKNTIKKKYTLIPLQRGMNLRDRLDQKDSSPPLTPFQKQIIALQCCELTDHLHKMGIIHCDIKPDNFMVNIDPKDPNHIKVSMVDFGLAKKLAEGKNDCYRGFECGTRGPPNDPFSGYMALESFGTNPKHSKSSDTFALGQIINKDLNLVHHDSFLYLHMSSSSEGKRSSLDKVITQLRHDILIQEIDSAKKLLEQCENVQPKGLMTSLFSRTSKSEKAAVIELKAFCEKFDKTNPETSNPEKIKAFCSHLEKLGKIKGLDEPTQKMIKRLDCVLPKPEVKAIHSNRF